MIDQDQLAGRLLHNRYALDAPLATGTAAVVYRGRDAVLNRPVAVKAVPLAAAAPYRQALAQTAAFTHPAVVALYDTLEAKDHLLLIQELVDGRALAAYLRAGLPSERALSIAVQIARALAYAHAHDIVHGDLTPSAVIVDRRAVVRINNVGLPPDSAYFTRLARALDDDAPTRLVGSTAATTAGVGRAHGGEDAGGERWEPTPAGDVRAVALLLWQVLAEPQASQGGETRVFRADVPEAVRELVWRAALPSRADAITDAETLALALDEVMAAIARQRPAIPELTPPALQAVRARGPSSPPPWADDETVVAEGGWGATGERRAAAGAPRHNITPTQAGMPHLRLPSRSAEEPGAAGRPPRWPGGPSAVASDGRAHAHARPEGQVNVPLVIAIGIALFVLFFLIGYVAQPIHLP